MSGIPVTIERIVVIEADSETVFEFLIDPKLMAEWFGIRHVLEPRVGGTFQVEVSPGNIATGVFTEVVPGRRVAFTWGWQSEDAALAALRPGTSTVQIDLEPHENGTLLRLVHTGLPKNLENIHAARWGLYLDRLAARIAATITTEKRAYEN
jgi:uncharacterized protein YndB with AHSA1/START domain